MQDMTLGQRIAERRKMLGFSQEALGERVGVSRQAICKWEADGTVPEIDKLIALSRLFGVSVGWLLGIEEEQKSGGLTEDQLKMVEEIVMRYQPPRQEEPQKKEPVWISPVLNFFRRNSWLPLAAAIAALVLSITTTVKLSNQVAYSGGMLNQLSINYDNMKRDIEYISGQVESMAQGQKLLAEFDLAAQPLEDLSGAKLTFNGVPKSWGPQDAGVITARLEGREVTRCECVWDGTALRGELELTAADGYEYYFLLTRADGTQEQQNLTPDIEDPYVIQMAEGLSFGCRIQYTGGLSFAREPGSEFWRMYLGSFDVGLTMPPLTGEQDDLILESAELVLYRSGQEISRYPLEISENNPVTVDYPNGPTWVGIDYHIQVFPEEKLALEDLTDEDWIDAVLEMTLRNGAACQETLETWDVSDAP